MKTVNYANKENFKTPIFLISGVLALLLTIAVFVVFFVGGDFTLSDFFIRMFGIFYIGLLYAIRILGGILLILSVIVGLLFASDYIKKYLFTIERK
jgi:hypothetical protein